MAWPVLTVRAERTKKVAPLSTCVTCPTLRYNPAVIAQFFATLGVMYPNRIALGVGSGEAMNDYPVTGKWPSPIERLKMLEEAVKIIRLLWTSNDFVTFKGEYFQIKSCLLYTSPSPRDLSTSRMPSSA